MSNLIINNTDVSTLLRDKFQKLGHGWITLLQVPIESTMAINTEAIKALQAIGYEGIYITVSKDYVELSKLLRAGGVDMGKLAFVDAISQMYGIAKVEGPNVSYVEGPLSIEAIVEAVSAMAPTMKSDKKFVFLDSITTILLYNSLERTLGFSTALRESITRLQVVGIMVSLSKGFANEGLIKNLTASANEVINI